MIEVHLDDRWLSIGGVHLKGIFFPIRGAQPMALDALASKLTPLQTLDRTSVAREAAQFADEFVGNFAVIIQGADWAVLLTDRSATIQLGVHRLGSRTVITDGKFNCATCQARSNNPCYRLLSYPVAAEDDTCTRVEGSSIVVVHDGLLQTNRRIGQSGRATALDLAAAVESVLLAGRRVVAAAAGRKIVLFLSGGLDSRLLAHAIAKATTTESGQVLAVTYTAAPGGAESRRARQAAIACGFRHMELQYTPELWKGFMRDNTFREHVAESRGLLSAPHIQDGPALAALRDAGTSDALVVHGHSADLVAGSRLARMPEALRTAKASSHLHTDLASMALWLVETGSSTGQADFGQVDQCRKCVLASLAVLRDELRPQDGPMLADEWDIRFRQSARISSNFRLVESFGHTPFAPFWSADFADYWLTLPLRARHGTRAYRRAAARISRDLSDVSWRRRLLNVAARNRVGRALARPAARGWVKVVDRYPHLLSTSLGDEQIWELEFPREDGPTNASTYALDRLLHGLESD